MPDRSPIDRPSIWMSSVPNPSSRIFSAVTDRREVVDRSQRFGRPYRQEGGAEHKIGSPIFHILVTARQFNTSGRGMVLIGVRGLSRQRINVGQGAIAEFIKANQLSLDPVIGPHSIVGYFSTNPLGSEPRYVLKGPTVAGTAPGCAST